MEDVDDGRQEVALEHVGRVVVVLLAGQPPGLAAQGYGLQWDDRAAEAEQLGEDQVWSLSSFKVSRQVLERTFDQVSSVSLLLTSSTEGFLS